MAKILSTSEVVPGRDFLNKRHEWPPAPPPDGRHLSAYVSTLRSTLIEMHKYYQGVYWEDGTFQPGVGERMGILIGRFLPAGGRWAVEVRGFEEVLEENSGDTHATLRTTSVDSALSSVRSRHPLETLVGWYHTHPGMDLFLSATDKETFDGLFPQPWHVAMVFDPRSWKAAYFLRDSQGNIPGDEGEWREFSMDLESIPRLNKALALPSLCSEDDETDIFSETRTTPPPLLSEEDASSPIGRSGRPILEQSLELVPHGKHLPHDKVARPRQDSGVRTQPASRSGPEHELRTLEATLPPTLIDGPSGRSPPTRITHTQDVAPLARGRRVDIDPPPRPAWHPKSRLFTAQALATLLALLALVLAGIIIALLMGGGSKGESRHAPNESNLGSARSKTNTSMGSHEGMRCRVGSSSYLGDRKYFGLLKPMESTILGGRAVFSENTFDEWVETFGLENRRELRFSPARHPNLPITAKSRIRLDVQRTPVNSVYALGFDGRGSQSALAVHKTCTESFKACGPHRVVVVNTTWIARSRAATNKEYRARSTASAPVPRWGPRRRERPSWPVFSPSWLRHSLRGPHLGTPPPLHRAAYLFVSRRSSGRASTSGWAVKNAYSTSSSGRTPTHGWAVGCARTAASTAADLSVCLRRDSLAAGRTMDGKGTTTRCRGLDRNWGPTPGGCPNDGGALATAAGDIQRPVQGAGNAA